MVTTRTGASAEPARSLSPPVPALAMHEAMAKHPLTEPILTAHEISRDYGEVRALDGVTLELFGGEVVALLGVNGAGKTTLMRILCGLDAPSSKTSRVQTSSLAPLREVVGYCPQELTIWPDLTAREQVMMLGRLQGMSRREAGVRAEHLLAVLGLSERSRELASRFSGGMKRRLSIAMALVHDPAILILDEAEVGLDPQSRVNLRAFITRLASEEGKAILLSTHGIDEVERIADRVVILDRGSVVASGPPDVLVETLGASAIITITLSRDVLQSSKGAAFLAELERSYGVITREDARITLSTEVGMDALEEVGAMTRRHGILPHGLSVTRPGLEDVFLARTASEMRGGA